MLQHGLGLRAATWEEAGGQGSRVPCADAGAQGPLQKAPQSHIPTPKGCKMPGGKALLSYCGICEHSRSHVEMSSEIGATYEKSSVFI